MEVKLEITCVRSLKTKQEARKTIGKIVFPCTVCRAKLKSEAHLKKHMVTRHQPKDFICDYEGKHFNSKDKLRLHIFQHRKYYRVQCTVCHREYRTNQSMRKHLRTHFEKNQCDACGQIFKHKRLLHNHISAFHTDERTIQCNCRFTLYLRQLSSFFIYFRLHQTLSQHYNARRSPEKYSSRSKSEHGILQMSRLSTGL